MSNNNEIEKRLWEAADQLRANSGLKYSQFSRPLLGLIFLRYADYKFAQTQKELEKASKRASEKGTMDAYIPRRKKISPRDYQAKGVIYLPEEARYSFILDLPESENIGKALNEAMATVENENDHLKGVLDIEYSEIEDSVLIALLKIFSEIDFHYDDDIFGKIYEYFLGKFAMGEGQRGGEFFTPESLVKLIVEVIEPEKGLIYDPACGSGGMFVQSANYIKRQGKDPMKEISVYGQEKTLDTVKLCKMNLAVHGIEGDIKQGNSYYEDSFNEFQKFDYVMANPPFNVNGVDKEKLSKNKMYSYGLPKNDNANFIWIQIFLNSLNETGRAGFVMANVAMDASQSEYQIRKKIIDDKIVDVIITIAPKFFYNVSLSCSLWFFDKSKLKNNRENKILFIDASKIYNKVDRAHRNFTKRQIEYLANIVRLYREEDVQNNHNSKDLIELNFPGLKYSDVPGLCKVECIEELKKRKFSLNPGKYIEIKRTPIKKSDFLEDLIVFDEKLKELNERAGELNNIISKNISKLIKTLSNESED